jgi:hypothetical protein
VIANAQFAHPYKVFSENGEYFIKSIPFSDQVWTEDGKTVICKANDTTQVITTIDRYFRPDFLFLSNDGKSFCFLLNRFDSGNDLTKDVIYFYSNGALVKKYKGNEFVDTTLNSRISSLCYNNDAIDSFVVSKGYLVKTGFKKGTDSLSAYFNTNSSFLKNDTLYLLTHNRFVNIFDLRTGVLLDKISFNDYSKGKLIYPIKRIIQNYNIKIPTQFGLPKLADGQDYCVALAKTMKMVYCHGENADYEKKYKKYRFDIYCGIDSLGNCVDLQMDCKDSLLRKEAEDFIKNAKFDKAEIPGGIERWYFRHGAGFRKESKDLAIEERKLEIIEEELQYKKRIVADSIDGIYIPMDINDCFRQLNTMLKPIDINEFKNLPKDKAMAGAHFGLGMWLRNNWGLWVGSRLSVYFNNMGIKHPDDMSGIILTSYHRFLNDRDIDLDSQVLHYKDYWKNYEKKFPKK